MAIHLNNNLKTLRTDYAINWKQSAQYSGIIISLRTSTKPHYTDNPYMQKLYSVDDKLYNECIMNTKSTAFSFLYLPR